MQISKNERSWYGLEGETGPEEPTTLSLAQSTATGLLKD